MRKKLKKNSAVLITTLFFTAFFQYASRTMPNGEYKTILFMLTFLCLKELLE